MSRCIRSLLMTVLTAASFYAVAGPNDPLFISLTSGEPHRVTMALNFGKHHNENGHPLSIFLSDQGVFVGIQSKAQQYADQQKMLNEIMAKGGTVIMCPMCLKHYGFGSNDVLPGIKMGSPKVTGDALFRDGTKTMTW